jgi:hypothetical protein
MRNDARPIGGEFRDIATHDEHEGSAEHPEAERARATPECRPLVIRRDPADQDPDASDR